MSDEPLTFSIAPQDFDLSLLPETARDRSGEEFPGAITRFFQEAFGGSGSTIVAVTPDAIRVAWNRSPSTQPLERVLAVLRAGRHKEGVQLLRLLLSRDPDGVDLLFNLGVALNELQGFEEAAVVLMRVVELAPDHQHAPAALAVALSRTGRNNEAVTVLRAAVDRNPSDLWTRLNLGATLLKQGHPEDAFEHLEVATRLQPANVRAWLGLGDALRAVSRSGEADSAYRRVIDLEPHGEGAELARQGLSRLAEAGFQSGNSSDPRPDAVEYCVAAIEDFRDRPAAEVQQIVFEITVLGRDGLDTEDSVKRYSIL